MEIRFKKLDYNNRDVFDIMAKWYNDKEIQHLFNPNFLESELEDITSEELRYHAIRKSNKTVYLIWDGEKLIGELSIDRDFEDLIKKESATAWVSICIGDKNYWSKGIGTRAMLFIEQECKKMKIERIELGVFDFNKRAKLLYEKLGYHQFHIVSNFVFYKGKWYDDIRMEKYI